MSEFLAGDGVSGEVDCSNVWTTKFTADQGRRRGVQAAANTCGTIFALLVLFARKTILSKTCSVGAKLTFIFVITMRPNYE